MVRALTLIYSKKQERFQTQEVLYYNFSRIFMRE